jgi:hypothetical protein
VAAPRGNKGEETAAPVTERSFPFVLKKSTTRRTASADATGIRGLPPVESGAGWDGMPASGGVAAPRGKKGERRRRLRCLVSPVSIVYKAVFSCSWEIFRDTVAFWFVCGNYCPIMD